MASVFLSYDRDDAKKARPLALALEKAGHSVWWDLHVRGGAQFSKVIEEALKAADAVVVLWSQNSIESPWVRDEAAAGRDTGRLIPANLDGTEPPLGFRQYQTIDLSRWNGRSNPPQLRTLFSDIEALGITKADVPPPSASPAGAESKRSPEVPRWALPAGTGVLFVLVLAGAYWQFGGSRDDLPTVAVSAADTSALSQTLAHNVLVNLGSVAGNGTPKFRLLDEDNHSRPNLRLNVSGIQPAGVTQATIALTSSGQNGILWSKQIQEPANQRSSLGQAAAYAAMGAISCAADGSGESRPLGATDFHAYLNACVSQDEAADLQPLVATFRKTVQAAPRFAAAWANLLTAEGYNLFDSKMAGQPTDEIESAMRRDIQSASKVNPDLPAANIAELSLQPPTAFLTRISLIGKAVAAHPDNADLLSAEAHQLSSVGRLDEALDDDQQATELEPYSAALRANYIGALAASGGLTKAWSLLAEAKNLWPGSSVIESTDTTMNLRYGNFETAWRSAGLPIDGGIAGYFKVLRDPSDANIDGWINLAKTHTMLHPHRMFILQALGNLDRVDQLYAFLDQWPIDKDLQGSTYVLFRPWMAKLRRDPRFMRLAQRVGLLDYWEKSGKWPDFCAEPDMPYDCRKEAAKLTA